MGFTKLWSILAISCLLIACSKPVPELTSFDVERWKADQEGCLHQRSGLVNSLMAQKEKLLALSESAVVEVLGKPDINELYQHNQKFYYYYLSPGPACVRKDSTSSLLEIRFNATGVSSEIYVVTR